MKTKPHKPTNRLPASNGEAPNKPAPQMVKIPLEDVQRVLGSLEAICRGGISADATDHVAGIKQLLIHAAQTSGAVPAQLPEKAKQVE